MRGDTRIMVAKETSTKKGPHHEHISKAGETNEEKKISRFLKVTIRLLNIDGTRSAEIAGKT